MTSAFSWQNCQTLTCFVLYSKDKFACYSRYLLTFYVCIPVPYNEKDIFFENQFQKVLYVFIEPLSISFLSIRDWGIDQNYCDIEWFALEMSRYITLSSLRLHVREPVSRQVDKKSRGCPRREGSGVLEEDKGIWDSQGGGKDKHLSLSLYIPQSYLPIKLLLLLFFFKPRTDDYITSNSV